MRLMCGFLACLIAISTFANNSFQTYPYPLYRDDRFGGQTYVDGW
jgi:hypothetical protein